MAFCFNRINKKQIMKTSRLIFYSFIIAILMMLTSCSVVTGIFKAGMGVGIFLVVLVIVVIVVIVSKARNR
jgi:hypothetical protein